MNETMKPMHSGQTYIFTPEGLVPFEGQTELAQIAELGYDVQVAAKEFETLATELGYAVQVAAKEFETLAMVFGLNQDKIDLCPNRRVRHLAQHARKRRVRKKNIHRAVDM